MSIENTQREYKKKLNGLCRKRRIVYFIITISSTELVLTYLDQKESM